MKTLLDIFVTFEGNKKTAVVYRTGLRRFTYSYKTIFEFTLQTAIFLEQHGVKKGDRVVIWAPNSPWWLVVYWACVIKGIIVTPIDVTSSKETANKISKQVEPTFIFQSEYLLEKFEQRNAIFIEHLQYLLKDESLPRHPKSNSGSKKTFADIKPHDIVELIFTSGTTSDPKGVVLTHRNIVSNIQQIDKQLALPKHVKVLSVLPLSHMFELTIDCLLPLFLQGTIVYIKTLKPSTLVTALSEEHVNVLIAVPRLLQALKNSVEREIAAKKMQPFFTMLMKFAKNKNLKTKKILFFPIHKKFGPNFLFFVSGGSKLDTTVWDFWQNLGIAVIEGYGLTECSPVLAANAFDNPIRGSVGKVLPGIEMKLENNEILVRGDNVFSTYWNNKKTTENSFTNDGFFKTGDEGKVDDNGNLYIQGRKKDVIITSAGVNIYPEDLEHVLNEQPGVREACVIGKETNQGEEIHAVFILENESVEPEKLIKEANAKLDQTQQIQGFSIWPHPEFPRTTTLKIQKYKVKQALEEAKNNTSDISYDALVNLIARVSAKPVKNITENSLLMTDLGISSIGRLELVNYLEQEYRLDLDDNVIDQNTKVKNLREVIQKREFHSPKTPLHMWQYSWFGKLLQRIGLFLFSIFTFKLITSLQVVGKENLKGVKEPVLFISNHISYIDASFIFFSLPRTMKYNTAIATREEFYVDKHASLPTIIWRTYLFWYTTICWNTFLLPQKRGFRETFVYMGKLVDRKINILIFPEGERSWDGKPLPFQAGLGILVKELQIPVVPIKLEGVEKILPRGTVIPKRAPSLVKIGKPIYFTTETPSEIVKIAEEKLLEL